MFQIMWSTHLLIVCCVLNLSFAARLNLPKLLLPYHPTIKSSYILEISDINTERHCYSWTSNRLDIIAIRHLDDDRKPISGDQHKKEHGGCSTIAEITVSPVNDHRTTAIVWVENQHTKHQLRCDVIIDRIASIDLRTTTQEIYIEDSPVAFSVTARNAEGSSFTTINHLAFEWQLTVDTAVGDQQGGDILRLLKYIDSRYESPDAAITEIESHNREGASILVEGLSTGVGHVTARLADPLYRQVAATSKRLIVVANIVLSPSILSMMPFASTHLTASVIKYGKSYPVDVPSAQYRLELQKGIICCSLEAATVTSDPLAVSADDISDFQGCECRVNLLDDHLLSSTATAAEYELPLSIISIQQPAYISVEVNDAETSLAVISDRADLFVLLIGRTYDFDFNVHDASDRRLLMPDNGVDIVVSTVVNGGQTVPLGIIERCQNGSRQVIRVDWKGLLKVNVDFVWSGGEGQTLKRLKKTLTLMGVEPIRVHPVKDVAIPFDHRYPPRLEYQLAAVGGSGHYRWSKTMSEPMTTMLLDSEGVVSVNNAGKTLTTASESEAMQFTVVDKRNERIFDSGSFVVGRLARLSFHEGDCREAMVGTNMTLNLTGMVMRGSKAVPVIDCSFLNITIRVSHDNDVFQLLKNSLSFVDRRLSNDEGVEDGVRCATIDIGAVSTGFSRVSVEYHTPEGLTLSDEVLIQAYEPLRVRRPRIEAKLGAILLSYGSAVNVVFDGGPLPWPQHLSHHQKHPSVVFDDDRYAKEDEQRALSWLPSKALSAMVLCPPFINDVARRTTMSVRVTVGNAKSNVSPKPRQESVDVIVRCEIPRRISLAPFVDRPNHLPPCPVTIDDERPIPVHADENILLELVAYDAEGNIFNNISGTDLTWTTDPAFLMGPKQAEQSKGSGLTTVTRKPSSTYRPSTFFAAFSPIDGARGDTIVTAQVVVSSDVSTASRLLLTEPMRLSTDHVTLFNVQGGVVEVRAVGGSGFVAWRTTTTTSSGDAEGTEGADEALKSIDVDIDGDVIYLKPPRIPLTGSVYNNVNNMIGDSAVRLTANDLCVHPRRVSSVHVDVINVDMIDVVGRKSIGVDETILIGVRLLSSSDGGKVLPAHLLNMDTVQHSVKCTVVGGERLLDASIPIEISRVQAVDAKHRISASLASLSAIYEVVSAKALPSSAHNGIISCGLQFETRLVNVEASLQSLSHRLDVFPPLALHPHPVIHLVQSSSYQFRLISAPECCRASISFTCHDVTDQEQEMKVTASCAKHFVLNSKNGWLFVKKTAPLNGRVSISASMYDIDPLRALDDQMIVYKSKASDARIVQMAGIQLVSPVHVVVGGADVPITCYGRFQGAGSVSTAQALDPFVYASVRPNPPELTWRIIRKSGGVWNSDSDGLARLTPIVDMTKNGDQTIGRHDAAVMFRAGHNVDVYTIISEMNYHQTTADGKVVSKRFTAKLDLEVVPRFDPLPKRSPDGHRSIIVQRGSVIPLEAKGSIEDIRLLSVMRGTRNDDIQYGVTNRFIDLIADDLVIRKRIPIDDYAVFVSMSVRSDHPLSSTLSGAIVNQTASIALSVVAECRYVTVEYDRGRMTPYLRNHGNHPQVNTISGNPLPFRVNFHDHIGRRFYAVDQSHMILNNIVEQHVERSNVVASLDAGGVSLRLDSRRADQRSLLRFTSANVDVGTVYIPLSSTNGLRHDGNVAIDKDRGYDDVSNVVIGEIVCVTSLMRPGGRFTFSYPSRMLFLNGSLPNGADHEKLGDSTAFIVMPPPPASSSKNSIGDGLDVSYSIGKGDQMLVSTLKLNVTLPASIVRRKFEENISSNAAIIDVRLPHSKKHDDSVSWSTDVKFSIVDRQTACGTLDLVGSGERLNAAAWNNFGYRYRCQLDDVRLNFLRAMLSTRLYIDVVTNQYVCRVTFTAPADNTFDVLKSLASIDTGELSFGVTLQLVLMDKESSSPTVVKTSRSVEVALRGKRKVLDVVDIDPLFEDGHRPAIVLEAVGDTKNVTVFTSQIEDLRVSSSHQSVVQVSGPWVLSDGNNPASDYQITRYVFSVALNRVPKAELLLPRSKLSVTFSLDDGHDDVLTVYSLVSISELSKVSGSSYSGGSLQSALYNDDMSYLRFFEHGIIVALTIVIALFASIAVFVWRRGDSNSQQTTVTNQGGQRQPIMLCGSDHRLNGSGIANDDDAPTFWSTLNLRSRYRKPVATRSANLMNTESVYARHNLSGSLSPSGHNSSSQYPSHLQQTLYSSRIPTYCGGMDMSGFRPSPSPHTSPNTYQ